MTSRERPAYTEFSVESNLEYHKLCLEAARMEKQWTNERLGWLFVPQGILFTALGLAYSDKTDTSVPVIKTMGKVLPELGIGISGVVLIAVFCAIWMHRKWTNEMRGLTEHLHTCGHRVTFGSSPSWPASTARWAPLFLPMFFIYVWLRLYFS